MAKKLIKQTDINNILNYKGLKGIESVWFCASGAAMNNDDPYWENYILEQIFENSIFIDDNLGLSRKYNKDNKIYKQILKVFKIMLEDIEKVKKFNDDIIEKYKNETNEKEKHENEIKEKEKPKLKLVK